MFIILISILLYQNSGEAFFVGVLSALLFSGVIWLISKIRQHRNERKDFDLVSREETFGIAKESAKQEQSNQKKNKQENDKGESEDWWTIFSLTFLLLLASVIIVVCNSN